MNTIKNIEIIQGRNLIIVINDRAYIILKDNLFGIVHAKDVNKIKDIKWWITGDGYVVANGERFVTCSGKKRYRKIYMHRIILESPFPVDHINGVVWDNRSSNLRSGKTFQEAIRLNTENRKPHRGSKTGIRGVYEFTNRTGSTVWVAKASVKKKVFNKTCYSLAEAIEVLDKWRMENMIGFVPKNNVFLNN